MQDSNDENLELDEAELWASWAEMEWEEGNDERCLEVLVMAAGMQRQAIGELISCPELTTALRVCPVAVPEQALPGLSLFILYRRH